MGKGVLSWYQELSCCSIVDVESKRSIGGWIPLAANSPDSMVVASTCANIAGGAGSVLYS